MHQKSAFVGLATVVLIVLAALALAQPAPVFAQGGATATARPCEYTPPPRLRVGEQAWITPGLPNIVREDHGTSARWLGEIPPGGVIAVLEGPICSSEMYWWRVDYQGLVGWTPEGDAQSGYWIEPAWYATAFPRTNTPTPTYTPTPLPSPTPVCGQALAPRLTIGEQAWVTPGTPNNLREQPGTSGRYLGEIPPGGIFTVLEGPVCASGYYWWRVDYRGTVGWTPEADAETYWLQPLWEATANPWTPTPTPTMPPAPSAMPTLPPAPAPITAQVAITLPPDLEPITADNASRLTWLGNLGDGWVSEVVWSPDSYTVAALASPRGAFLFDINNFSTPRCVLENDRSLIVSGGWFSPSGVFSPDGALFAYGLGSEYVEETLHEIAVWDTDTCTQVSVLRAGGDAAIGVINILAFSADHSRLAEAGQTFRVWDTQTGALLAEMPNQGIPIYGLAFSQDGRFVAVADQNYRAAYIWDTTTQAQYTGSVDPANWSILIPNADGSFRIPARRSPGVSPDGRWSVTIESSEEGVGEQSLRLQEVASGAEVTTAHLQPQIWWSDAAFAPDGSLLAWGWGGFRRWNLQNGESATLIYPDSLPITDVGPNQNGTLLVLFSAVNDPNVQYEFHRRIIEVWDTAGLARRAGTQYTVGGNVVGYASAYSPDGRTIVTGERDGTIRLWDVPTMMAQGTPESNVETRRLWMQPDGVTALAFSPDSSLLASGGEEGIIWLRNWRVQGEPRTRLDLPPDSLPPDIDLSIRSIVFSPDSRWIAALMGGEVICVWDVQTRQFRHALEHSGPMAWDMAFSPDGSLLALDAQGTITIFDMETGGPLTTFAADYSALLGGGGVTFSPDGRLLVTAGSDGAVRLWGVLAGN